MTQIYLHPYRPEQGETRAMRKLARNYRAEYQHFQSTEELVAASSGGRWVSLESRMPGSMSVHSADWEAMMTDSYAQAGGLHIVTGSMNHGLPAEVLETMDYNVHIPQFDDVPFLAPATAAAICLHEIFMQTANRSGVHG